MFYLSKKSLERLHTCDGQLILLFETAIKTSPLDFCIICGHRGKSDQETAFLQGRSKLHYPFSKHNLRPSLAVDAAPYPIDWDNIQGFIRLSMHIQKVAKELEMLISWGGYWKMKDYPHYELIEVKDDL